MYRSTNIQNHPATESHWNCVAMFWHYIHIRTWVDRLSKTRCWNPTWTLIHLRRVENL